uniref:Uncharacterized protein n=1 Tax=Arundo donax TaxID=35708 RepID=A0A0A9AQN5_ARUDO
MIGDRSQSSTRDCT